MISAAVQLPPDSTRSEATTHNAYNKIRVEHICNNPWHLSSDNRYLNSKVYEATNVEGVLHEVKDELNVLDEWQVIRHP